MRYFVLATDYDGTLAEYGMVPGETTAALKKLRDSGRQLVLVTGRLLPDLQRTYQDWEIFRFVVAENGALLFDVPAGTETLLTNPPPPEFAETLKRKGVHPVDQGKVIVSTTDIHKEKVLETISELGLELQIIFNKGSAMVLPSGVNKATGLKAAVRNLGISMLNVVGVGDAENDHAFLRACGRSVAVANALPYLKDQADLVTRGEAGNGVAELATQIIENDLASVPPKDKQRESLLLGNAGETEIRVPFFGSTVLVAGPSGGGKSTLTTGVMERLTDAKYQFLSIDPEGDYQKFEGALVFGDAKRVPTLDETLNAIEHGNRNIILNLLGVHVDDRPDFFEKLAPRIQELRTRTGRPHWLIVDEAHHLMPVARERTKEALPQDWSSALFITLQPDRMPDHVLASMNHLIALGERPDETFQKFCRAAHIEYPEIPEQELKKGTAFFWAREPGNHPQLFSLSPCRTQQARHSRKYATADLAPDRSFYFRGPEARMNLRAPNLITFVRLLEGIDDETWLYHLHRGDYSEWFRTNIKSDELAEATKEIEGNKTLSAAESRTRIKDQIEQHFTLPA
jgi:hydroxymethylpyrimidine pyrophosphatase-like HAD family hydrolase